MKNDLEKNIKSDLSSIRMTEHERSQGKEKLLAFAKYNPPQKSFVSPLSFIFGNYRYSLVITAAIILIVSLPTYKAAADSLPGDILYPIKTDVIEEIGVLFQPNFKEKAKYHVSLAERRLKEASQLSELGREDGLVEIQEQMNEHVEETLESFSSDNNTENLETIDTISKLNAVLESHSEFLDEIEEDRSLLLENEENEEKTDNALEVIIDNISEEQKIEAGDAAIQLLDKLETKIDDTSSIKDGEILKEGLEEALDAVSEENYGKALSSLLESQYLIEIQEEEPAVD